MKYYAKLADDPTYYFVDDGTVTKVEGIAMMHSIGLHPIRKVSRVELDNLLTGDTSIFPLVSHLSDYRVILVSGPHRSGTTIAAKIIATETKKTFLTEESFGPDNESAWRELISSSNNAVIQCPSMCHLILTYEDDESVAAVMVIRDLQDILASQEKVGWTSTGVHATRYNNELSRYPDASVLAEGKYAFWEQASSNASDAHAIHYEDLSSHPLWVNDRSGFGPRDTE